jgi:hypothetical protein
VVAAWRGEHDTGVVLTGDCPTPHDPVEVSCVLRDHSSSRSACRPQQFFIRQGCEYRIVGCGHYIVAIIS